MTRARLAGPGIRWRELTAILIVAGLLALIFWTVWATTPTKGPQTHVEAKVVGLSARPDSKWAPAYAIIEVELPNGAHQSLRAPYPLKYRCLVGDKVTLIGTPNNAGGTMMRVDRDGCRPSPQSPR